MTGSEPGRFAVWLLPCDPDRTALRDTVRRLAREHAAPVFEPHVTVFAGRRARGEDVPALLAAAVAGVGPLELQSTGCDCSADYFKTVFMTFRGEAQLEQISTQVGARLRQPQRYDLRPHLSLIYKTMAEAAQRELISGLGPQPPHVSFDTVAVAVPGPTDDWHDVENWAIEARMSLQSGRP